MLSTYCQHCGGKNEYRLTKPKFCSSCGQPLSQSERGIQKPKADLRKHSRAMEMSIDDKDGTDIYEVPNISSLEYEIEVSNSNFTLGSIMPNQPIQENPIQPKRKRGRPKKHG